MKAELIAEFKALFAEYNPAASRATKIAVTAKIFTLIKDNYDHVNEHPMFVRAAAKKYVELDTTEFAFFEDTYKKICELLGEQIKYDHIAARDAANAAEAADAARAAEAAKAANAANAIDDDGDEYDEYDSDD